MVTLDGTILKWEQGSKSGDVRNATMERVRPVDPNRYEFKIYFSIGNSDGNSMTEVHLAAVSEQQRFDVMRLIRRAMDSDKIVVRVLDFAGQAEFYMSHRLFLDLRAVFVVVSKWSSSKSISSVSSIVFHFSIFVFLTYSPNEPNLRTEEFIMITCQKCQHQRLHCFGWRFYHLVFHLRCMVVTEFQFFL